MQEIWEQDRSKLVVLAVVGIIFSLGFAVVMNQNPAARNRSDIFLRWYAIDKLFSEDRNVYDGRNGEEAMAYVWGEQGYPRNVNFFYPAHLIILLGPLALLPYSAAHLIWTVIIQWFFLAGLWLTARWAGWPDSTNALTAFLVAATLSIPHLQHTVWGQFNTIGVLSLALCYQALRSRRYGLAGVVATGLTFKPHTTLLPLAFLFVWSFSACERWRFSLSFALACAGQWAVTELLQPGWLSDFLATLRGYGTTTAALDLFGIAHPLVGGAVTVAALAVIVRNRKAPAASPSFAGCLSFSVAVWFLVVPVVGMLHTVLLPMAVVLLFSSLRSSHPGLYPWALYSMLVVYGLGILGFTVGLSTPALYGKHIYWSELAYKAVAPVLVALFSLPVCLGSRAKEGSIT